MLAEAALRLDPLHEAACRRVMRLAAEDGEIGAALRAYAGLYERLGRELDMEPSLATQELVAQVEQGQFEFGRSRDRRSAGGSRRSPVHSRCGGGRADRGGDAVPLDRPRSRAGLFRRRCRRGHRAHADDTARARRHFKQLNAWLPGPAARLAPDRPDARRPIRGVRHAAGFGRPAAAFRRAREVARNSVLWSEAYDASEPTLFETQNELAAKIARTLVPRLREAELQQSRRKAPENLTAYHLMRFRRAI